MHDLKMTDELAGVEFAGLENDGLEIGGLGFKSVSKLFFIAQMTNALALQHNKKYTWNVQNIQSVISNPANFTPASFRYFPVLYFPACTTAVKA